MIRRLVLIGCGLLMAGCTLLSSSTTPKFPDLPIQSIPQKYGKMGKDDVRRSVGELRLFLQHLDLYIDRVHGIILKENYITRKEWMRHCGKPLAITPLELPKHGIRDDSSVPDIAIIDALVQYIRQVRIDVEKHNAQIAAVLKKYQQQCTLE